MSYRTIALIAAVLLLGPAVAKATVVTGSFAGAMSDGTDTTGVFGAVGGDLTGDAITGTFTYDTTLFTQVVPGGGTNTATGTPGALTVTITINGFTHTFTDQTSSSIFLDDGTLSGNSEVTLNTLNQKSPDNESFTLDAQDPINPFIASTDLAQSFTDSPFISDGAFQILDTGLTTVASGGGFTIASISASPAATAAVPEPATLALLAVGLVGLTGGRMRGKRRLAKS